MDEPLAWWSHLDFLKMSGALTALVAASSPVWLRLIQRKDDAHKLEVAASENAQQRLDKMAAAIRDDAFKEAERSDAKRIDAIMEADYYRSEAFACEEQARDFRHRLINRQEAFVILFNRFKLLSTNDLPEEKVKRIIADYIEPTEPPEVRAVVLRAPLKGLPT